MQDEKSSATKIAVGKIKWFDEVRGYGFIESTSGQEIYLSYKVLSVTPGLPELNGLPVEYECKETSVGSEAIWARVKSPGTEATEL